MDVVRKLDRARRPGESYSDVIARQLEEPPSLTDLIRYLRAHPESGPDDLTPQLREIRREANRSYEARRRRLEKMR